MRPNSAAVLLACTLLTGGCVPLPPGEAGSVPRGGIVGAAFGDLDPGYKTLSSLHFEVRAPSSETAQRVSELAERSYEGIMRDTGLMSFMPRGLYPVLVYGSREEYLRKTGMPSWSGGAAAGNSIYTYESARLPSVLSHEMTHLVFREYMGRDREDLRWVNEGLAVFEEYAAVGAFPPGLPAGRAPMPFSRMADAAPLSEEAFDATAWYAQASSVVRFMLERGGRIGFGQFMAALKDGRPLDEAVRSGFPGSWSGLAALEDAWRRGLR